MRMSRITSNPSTIYRSATPASAEKFHMMKQPRSKRWRVRARLIRGRSSTATASRGTRPRSPYSLSACLVPARPWSSKYSPAIVTSTARGKSAILAGRCLGSAALWPKRSFTLKPSRGFRTKSSLDSGRIMSGAFRPPGRRPAGQSHRQQNARQFPLRGADRARAAGGALHSCPARPDRHLRLLFFDSIHGDYSLRLRLGGTGALLSGLRIAHGRLADGAAAGQDAGSTIRGRRRRSGRTGASHRRTLRPRLGSDLPPIPSEQPNRSHGQHGSGAPSALQEFGGAVARLRALHRASLGAVRAVLRS